MKPADLLPDDALFARLEHYGHCDVLIDRMVGWPLLDQLSGNAAVVVTAEPLADRLFEGIPDESPILVRLSGEGTALISSYLSEAIREAKDMSCQTRAVCGFLFSEAPLGKLAKRLTHQLEMRVTGGKSIFFRYFDPRVMHHLPSIFRPGQMGQLLSDIDYWMYIDWGGNAVTLNNADYPAVAPQDTRRLVAHSQQWLALQDIECFNLAIRMMRQAEQPMRNENEAALFSALALARLNGMVTPEDRAMLGIVILTQGETILRNRQMQAALSLVHSESIPLKDILEAQLVIDVTP